jgi:hypothetical protein
VSLNNTAHLPAELAPGHLQRGTIAAGSERAP